MMQGGGLTFYFILRCELELGAMFFVVCDNSLDSNRYGFSVPYINLDGMETLEFSIDLVLLTTCVRNCWLQIATKI